MSEEEVCTYCEKSGQLVTVRGMQGRYHLRCLKDAKAAWEVVRSQSFVRTLLRMAGR